MPRLKKQPIITQEKLKIPEKYLRFATPKEVAIYRAERLKCDSICEIGAGIGGQTLAFAKECKRVIAIESDRESLEILRKNLKKLKIKNVTLIHGDGLSDRIIESVKKELPDIIFCDTERAPEGERSIKEIKPNIIELLKKYAGITRKIAIEIPPFTKDLENLKEIFEKEFISLNGKLNRLTLYFNQLKKAEVSVVCLPSKERIEKENIKDIQEKKHSNKKHEFLYVINPAVILAGLEKELAKKLNVTLDYINEKLYLFSDKKIKSNLIETYKILDICSSNYRDILSKLKELKTGKTILRYNISPSEYWKERNSYEKSLEGNKEIHIFKGKEAFLCEKI